MGTSTVIIRPATTAEDLVAVAKGFQTFADGLGVDLSFQNFAAEVAGLPGKYASPTGALLIAVDSITDEVLGCVGLRPIEIAPEYKTTPGRHCEVKRLFVYPEARGRSVGRLLVRELVRIAQAQGYDGMVLDTLARLVPAVRLYRSEGFVEIARYYFNSIEKDEPVVYLRLPLGPSGA
ncbi:acyl-CoA N-acyltransferase [Stachybotrys elegans]|uniref:Acyl-CoA N-acyltransferase n=1 Tax=Stachybotrys elegans TaxID=80388 RepID=A0A8K0SAQ2_9HYPO|nr:acyl-CoA N-acyltransferase [Stachybotrys elegans]